MKGQGTLPIEKRKGKGGNLLCLVTMRRIYSMNAFCVKRSSEAREDLLDAASGF